ncbi:MAG TPA: glycosyltransferase [Actinomycetota bacterium]|jgi:glycosyltransferase involved in cell wall biosynthesis|nr:glycosyltransferase [Actinomycetota bacterium]
MREARVVALVAAHDEVDRVGDTVVSLASISCIDEVVVVDDGSADATAAAALAAGATVLRVPRRVGKGRAVEGALNRLEPARVWLLADADLGRTASRLEPLARHVLDGRADLAIATFPPLPGGGFGTVKRFAARAIALLTRFPAAEPLSGQRAISAGCLAACRPLAGGFGLETAMTIDAVRAGFRVTEMPVDGLGHRPTGRSLRGFAHRGRQGIDILRAVVVRSVRLR